MKNAKNVFYNKYRKDKYRSELTESFFRRFEGKKIKFDFVEDKDKGDIIFFLRRKDEYGIRFKEEEIEDKIKDIVFFIEKEFGIL